MKLILTLFTTLIVALVSATTSHAQSPLPPKSSISIKETSSQLPVETLPDTRGCKLAHNLVTFTPTVRLGADVQAGPVIWRFYAAIENTDGKGLQLVKEQSLNPTEPATISPVVADAKMWKCSCCQRLNKYNPKLLGWYAELSKDGKVIASAQKGGGMGWAKLLESKPEVPKSKFDSYLKLSSTAS